jgi:hypothetical protein
VPHVPPAQPPHALAPPSVLTLPPSPWLNAITREICRAVRVL